MISKQKNAERLERRQQKLDAGLISARYPGVASIVIAMNYYKRGSSPSFMQRTVNFFPGSAAYFHMECMEDKCIDGGFNLEPIIYTMVKGHQESANGELTCAGNDSSGHRRIDYKIAIQYS
ncbi:MAG: hypothetical protein AB1553_04500 [Nitrospirota bacterium]